MDTRDIDPLDEEATCILLQWQIDLGASEAICDQPVNRYDLPKTMPSKTSVPPADPVSSDPQGDPVTAAKHAVDGLTTLQDLQAALGAFEQCELKRGARNLVFSDGDASAKVMIIGEAPGADEDRQGKPFVGRAGRLLDAMLAAIEHGRDHAQNKVYITNILPWRPPQNRDPKPEEIAMMLPFVEKHIELVSPDVIVLMGNIACSALLGQKGITRLRGNWVEVQGKPALPMFHPAYLLRNPAAKREAWHDLLMLKTRLAKT